MVMICYSSIATLSCIILTFLLDKNIQDGHRKIFSMAQKYLTGWSQGGTLCMTGDWTELLELRLEPLVPALASSTTASTHRSKPSREYVSSVSERQMGAQIMTLSQNKILKINILGKRFLSSWKLTGKVIIWFTNNPFNQI